ncbi:Sas10/Utp3/C1D family-domain-containing protein [Polychytrium aggregatum]|uniref:Sas10/Utp3/C1D family-domain-containing protein n=1 Tax=Polychytrium aggregatum TaxID=110093 RepID=UPI0022FDDEB8|nr:Sas10/Utp3/C1D family-domain-containing protein [Polychytrium aggregatum]KAI9207537.1 Sas10/Utp3/C1D family-domain-containing protein [Polychytrium aggregatum]
MSSAEVLELVQADAAEFPKLVRELTAKAAEIRSRLVLHMKQIKNGSLPTSKGVSLYEVKLHSLLSYITNLSYYFLLKIHGHRIEDHPVVDQLVELRIVMERIKPLEQKLKYQIDKLLKASSSTEEPAAVTDIQNPLQFKPNPQDLVQGDGDAADDDSADIAKMIADADKVYKPPRIAPMPYEDGPRNKFAVTEKMKERASKSRLMREITAQYDSRPEEITSEGTGYGARDMSSELDQRWKDIEEFEEANFVRKNLTRDEKKLERALRKRGATLRFQDELGNFDDFRDLQGLNQTVSRQDRQVFGSGAAGKRNKHSEQYESGKRKFADAGEMISSLSQGQTRRAPVSEFDRQLKKAKKRRA